MTFTIDWHYKLYHYLICSLTVEYETGKGAINEYCPRCGKSVASDSPTLYRYAIAGFCDPHSRDDFAANFEERSNDKRYLHTFEKQLVIIEGETR